jgi:hypothetical protein
VFIVIHGTAAEWEEVEGQAAGPAGEVEGRPRQRQSQGEPGAAADPGSAGYSASPG